ncbi:MAG: hypothetical protein JWQ17_4599 [Tardiphaga sp.]|nr:hypothetical protein [Tardiphaga sp.]
MDRSSPTPDTPRTAAEATPDQEALFRKLKSWFLFDFEKQAEWREAAREDFAFTSGDQLSETDKQKLRDMNRPIIIMNRVEPIIDSVSGSEVANRQEVQFIPRKQGDVTVNEVLTSAAKWFRDQCDAEDEESDAFREMVVCGMGWTETRLDYEDDPDGAPKIERRDPLEMVWDSTAKKRNLVDMRRLFHVCRNIPIDEARALCPNDDFEDADYNAGWVDSKDSKEAHHNNSTFYDKDDASGETIDKTVTMVRAQWWEREPVWRVMDPTNPDNILSLDKDAFDELGQKAKLAGAALRFARQTRKVFKQAYLGAILLEIGEAPCRDHFSFKCMTGKRDRNRNSFYGLVRAMKDPARWSNKWMSQTMHIMNTSAKGGIMAERGGFFENDLEGEESYAKQDQVTYLKAGALSGVNPKFAQKPQTAFPSSTFELMNFAITSLRDVSGVNVEILGMQSGASQAARLDLQRKQSAMTILQPLFDSLRRYRKEQGRLLLYLIENYLSDGRLIKIVGQDQAQYVPLVRQPGVSTYDVIVDESPTSPNQKEATWAMLQQILPVVGKMLPPTTWLALLKYSPLPTSAQQDISRSIAQSQPNQPPDPEAAKAAAELQAQNAKVQADIANQKAMTEAKIEGLQREAEAKAQIALRSAAAESIRNMNQPQPGPDGETLPAQPDGAALVMAMMHEFQLGMKNIADAMNAPKQIVRDPNGEPIGIAPVPNGRMN